jgi:hypothetical protein
MTPRLVRPFLALLLGLALAPPTFAQAKQPSYPESLFGSLRYRLVGPFRGGRCAAVTGVSGKPLLFYFGATGGGVWRTSDGGASWSNISDGFFGGSIGAVAVSESDPNVIYVGGGEKTVRGNVSHGASKSAGCTSPPGAHTRLALKVQVPDGKRTVRSGLPARTILLKECLSATCKGSCDVSTPRTAPAPRPHLGEWA